MNSLLRVLLIVIWTVIFVWGMSMRQSGKPFLGPLFWFIFPGGYYLIFELTKNRDKN